MINDLCLISLNDISREGLRRILANEGFNLLLSTSSVEGALQAEFDSEVLFLLDLPTSELQIEAARKIMDAYKSAKVAVLVPEFQMHELVELFNIGVAGYIVQTVNSAPLIAAFRLVALGKKVLPSELAEVISGQTFEAPPMNANIQGEMDGARLSVRERDVLCCLMAGYSNKVIARELDVCEATVKVHVKAILRKLNVNNRTQAAMWASSRGFAEYHSGAVAGPQLMAKAG